MKRSPLLLLILASVTFAQYDDYPVGEYEYPHHRIVVSPVTIVGGMDAGKRDEGPKVDLIFVPGITIQELRYEYVDGAQGTLGWGPVANVYLGLDSVKATSYALGMFTRLYAGLGTGSYVQMGLQYYYQTGTKLFNGGAHEVTVGADTLIAQGNVKVQGPQISPTLGYQKILARKWILEAQMGFTVGWYKVEYTDLPESFTLPRGDSEDSYKTGSDWGGFYFAQIALGYAF